MVGTFSEPGLSDNGITEKGIAEAIDDLWKLVYQYNLSLKNQELVAKRLDSLKLDNAPSWHYVEVSKSLADDFFDNHEIKSPVPLWQFLSLYLRRNITFKTSVGYSCTVSFKVDDIADSEKALQLMKSKGKTPGSYGPIGFSANAETRSGADAFKQAINALHSYYFRNP